MLASLLNRLEGHRVLVCGDVMLDEYVFGTVTRISPEAPVPIVEADLERHCHVPGGAANVARNLRALGAHVTLVGAVGDDHAGDVLTQMMMETGIGTEGLVVEQGRPTTLKTRIVAHQQQVVRVDRESREPLQPTTHRRMLEVLREHIEDGADAVALSDYDKGAYRTSIAEDAVVLCQHRKTPCLANPKPSNIRRFAGAMVLTLNVHEAERVLGRSLADKGEIAEAATELRSELDVEGLIITRGGDGLVLAQGNNEVLMISAIPVEVFDVVGAGDTVLSALTLAVAAGASLPEAAALANIAGGAVVRKMGTATVTLEELRSLL